MDELITVSIRNIEKGLWWKAKALASSREITIRELVIALLEKEIKKNGK